MFQVGNQLDFFSVIQMMQCVSGNNGVKPFVFEYRRRAEAEILLDKDGAWYVFLRLLQHLFGKIDSVQG